MMTIRCAGTFSDYLGGRCCQGNGGTAADPRLRPQPAPFSEFDSPSRSSRTSASRNRRCPPGVRMLLIRPDAAHRVTVFGSTLKSAATSPGVSRRSLLPSIAPTPWVRGLSPSVAETRELSHKQQLYPSIRKIPYAEVFVALLHTARQGRPCACACPHTACQSRPCAALTRTLTLAAGVHVATAGTGVLGSTCHARDVVLHPAA